MQTSIYQTVKSWELRSDEKTKVRTEVSMRDTGAKRFYRIGTFRVYHGADGSERNSPWLGLNDLRFRPGWEKMASEWVRDQLRTDRVNRTGVASAGSKTATTDEANKAA